MRRSPVYGLNSVSQVLRQGSFEGFRKGYYSSASIVVRHQTSLNETNEVVVPHQPMEHPESRASDLAHVAINAQSVKKVPLSAI